VGWEPGKKTIGLIMLLMASPILRLARCTQILKERGDLLAGFTLQQEAIPFVQP
jgi:hypothetical protein